MKNGKIEIFTILIDKFKNMKEKPDFEQKYYSQKATSFCKNGQKTIKVLTGMAHCHHC